MRDSIKNDQKTLIMVFLYAFLGSLTLLLGACFNGSTGRYDGIAFYIISVVMGIISLGYLCRYCKDNIEPKSKRRYDIIQVIFSVIMFILMNYLADVSYSLFHQFGQTKEVLTIVCAFAVAILAILAALGLTQVVRSNYIRTTKDSAENGVYVSRPRYILVEIIIAACAAIVGYFIVFVGKKIVAENLYILILAAFSLVVMLAIFAILFTYVVPAMCNTRKFLPCKDFFGKAVILYIVCELMVVSGYFIYTIGKDFSQATTRNILCIVALVAMIAMGLYALIFTLKIKKFPSKSPEN